MSKSWLYIMLLMIGTSIFSAWSGSILISVLLDLLVLGVGYYILRRDPWVNLRLSMIFLTILMGINILDTLQLISHAVNTQALIALVVWSWFGSHSKIFRYTVLGCVIYNSVNIVQLYRATDVLDWHTGIVSLMAVLLVSYIDVK